MPDGPVKHVHERGETFYDAAGRPIRSIGTVQDVTEQALIQDELRRSRAALAEAQRIAQLGSWTLDLRTGVACWSDEERRQASVVRSQGSVTVEEDQSSVGGNCVGRMENLDFPGQLRAAEERRRLPKLG